MSRHIYSTVSLIVYSEVHVPYQIYQRTKPRIHWNLKFYAYIRVFARKIPVRTIVIYDLQEDFAESYLRVNARKWDFLRAFYDLRVNKKSPYVGNPSRNPLALGVVVNLL